MTTGRALRPGDELAGYRVDACVGRGGMGEVFRAHDERLGRDVAVKLLAPQRADDPAFRDRLLRESRLAASLDHPNVVPVYDAGEVDGRLYLVMRYVDGTDLRALLRRAGALEPARALAIADGVAAALDAAHEHGLVHRDVKPSNVLLDARGHPYLADFGLTRSPSDPTPGGEGQELGTVDYVPPEGVRGEASEPASDVYSFGCLLYEALTGEVPYPRPTAVATLFAHLEEPPAAASAVRPDLPAELDAVLQRALAKEPAERQASCGEVVAQAREALGLEAPRRPSRWWIAALAAVLVAAAIAVAAVVLTRDDPAEPEALGTLTRIDPATNRVTRSAPLSPHPGVVVVASDRVWVGDFEESSLYSVDVTTGRAQRVASIGEPRDLTALGNDVYVASDAEFPEGTVTRYDARTAVKSGGIDLLACALGAGDGVLWAAGCPFADRLSTGPGDLRIEVQVELPFPEPRTATDDRFSFRALAVGEGSVWLLGDAIDRRVYRLDPQTGELLATVRLPVAGRSIAAGGGGVWVTAPLEDVVLRIDPATTQVTATIPVGRGASGVAIGDGAVWVASSLDGTVARIDPATARVTATIDVGGRPRELAVGAGAVWVTSHA
jgi:YVTN family beta-propeller protein